MRTIALVLAILFGICALVSAMFAYAFYKYPSRIGTQPEEPLGIAIAFSIWSGIFFKSA